MPDMSGYETTRQIRAMADMKKAGIRIIAMTQCIQAGSQSSALHRDEWACDKADRDSEAAGND